MKNFSKISSLFLFALQLSINAQVTTFVWKNVNSEKVFSNTVNDRFKVDVKLPDTYYDSTKTYPVLIVLDGDLLFPISLGATHYLESGNHLPEMIIVGIGYGAFEWFNGNNRSRDYTAHPTEGRPYEGGAEVFLEFLKDELIPHLSHKFRIDESRLVLMGHSLGGQFVVNAFLSEPSLFKGYIASSPNIAMWQDYFWNTLEVNREKINQTSNKIFISVGEKEVKEIYLQPIDQLVNNLKNDLLKKERIIFKKIENGEHFIVPSIALVYGLVELFEE